MAISLLSLACLATGCATTYAPRTIKPTRPLQWPYAPAAAKLAYRESLTGFAPRTDSRSLLAAIVVGSDSADRDAFVLPVAVAVGADGRIAVADAGRRCVHLYLPVGQRYARLTGSQEAPLVSPVGLAFDDALRLHVADSAGRLLTFGADGAFINAVSRLGDEPLQRPTGLAYSPTNHLLYVVDTLANKVHAVRGDSTLEFSFGTRGEEPGKFNFPTHIFRSSRGELYVTNALNFRIEIFDERGTPVGSFGRHGDGSGDLAMPKGVAVDRDGVVYVVDAVFDNVQLFDRGGEFLLTLGQRGTDFGEFWLPAGTFVDADNVLYVCDTYNRRVQVFRITEAYGNATH